jgi:hypothetical protein
MYFLMLIYKENGLKFLPGIDNTAQCSGSVVFAFLMSMDFCTIRLDFTLATGEMAYV